MAEEQRRDGVIEFPHARLTAGGRLRAAREAAGLSLADMAAQTKIPIRMLTLIEAGDYAALPAKAYATGFSRTCARALGLDEAEILSEVRRELGHVDPADNRLAPAFEPGDPARVPTARFAWLAAVAALAVLAAGLLLWRSYYAPAVTLPSLTAAPAAPALVPAAPAASVVVPLPAPSMQVPNLVETAPAALGAAPAGALPAPVAGVPPAAPRTASKPRTAPATAPTTQTSPPGAPAGPSAGAVAAGAAVAATPAAAGASAPTSTTP